VLAAPDGMKALTILAGVPVDVIVLDLSMPIMSGWEFLEARSGDPTLAPIPVVVVSAFAAGVDGPWAGFLTKPFGIDQLVEAIEGCRRPVVRRDTPTQLPR
jgi:CheY-like chemotaxis protein